MGVLDYIRYPALITAWISESLVTAGIPEWVAFLVTGIMGILAFVLLFMLPVQLGTVWVERRLIGRFQIRLGPDRVGPVGSLQPVADALKGLFKESWVPAGADKWVFMAAPMILFLPAIAIYAVIPFGPNMQIADVDIGILYLLSISSIGVIGVFMAGWSSNNKYSLLGAMRSVAQMVSYEVPMLLSLIGVILLVGSLRIQDIVNWQIANSAWMFLLQPLGLLTFFIAGLAETSRTPFDMAEAESELGAGYHTEYPGIRFMMFYAAEYTHAMALCALLSVLFFGGWGSAWGLDILPPWFWMYVKIWFFFCVLVWIRATIPRLRIDQLMGFAWKFLIPISLINILFTAGQVVVADQLGVDVRAYVIAGGIVLNLVAGVAIFAWWANVVQAAERRRRLATA
jgi:NADH-quinone oxidoreductase subunit H